MAVAYSRQGFWARVGGLFFVFAVISAQMAVLRDDEAHDKCEVHERILCGGDNITAADCGALNCCFDGGRCYYGNTVTVQCTRDGQFLVVVAKDSTVPQLHLLGMSLLGGHEPPCSPVAITDTFAIYHFPVSACGTTLKVDDAYIVYENLMTSSYEVGVGSLGSITRDSHFELLFQCRFRHDEVLTVVPEVNTVAPPLPVVAAGPLTVALRLANGQCHERGCNEAAGAYTSYYQESDYPVTKVLQQPVYVEVHMLEKTDPGLVLLLENCWATSTPDPFALPQWSLLVNGCPYQGDKYQTRLVPVDASGLLYPSHYKRFVVRMFSFLDPSSEWRLEEKVFIHCSTAVCHQSTSNSCEQTCFRKSRDLAAVRKGSSDEKAMITSGEINLVAPTTPGFRYAILRS